MKHKIISGLFWLFLSVVAAATALGVSRKIVLTPKQLSSVGVTTRNFYADGWLAQGARVVWSGLADRGNELRMVFEAWRPVNSGPANLTISVCGREVANVVVLHQLVQVIPLGAGCPDHEVTIAAKNPVTASESDPRELAVQFSRLEVTSRLRVPLVDYRSLAPMAAVLWLLSLILALREVPWGRGAAFVLLALVPAIAWQDTPLDIKNLSAWAVLLLAMLLGSAVSRDGSQQCELKERVTFYLLALAIAAGTVLRLYGISFGLPGVYHPDELQKVGTIESMMRHGDLNPRYFLHPSFLLYLTYAMKEVAIDPLFPGHAPHHTIILAGRLVSALAGSLSILLTFILGKSLIGARQGAWAALLLAFAPLSVTTSRYLKEDALLTLLVLATLVAIANAVRTSKPRRLLIAGLLVGVTASTKYTGALMVVALATAPWLAAHGTGKLFERRWLIWTGASLACAPLMFLLCSPYVLLDYARFARDFGFEQSHMVKGHTTGIDAWSQLWVFHIRRSIVPGIGLLASVLAALGAGLALASRDRRLVYIVGISLLFLLPAEFVRAKPAPQFERYVVPVLPFLALLASLSSSHFVRWRLVGTGFLTLAVALVCARTYGLARDLLPDTRERAARWIESQLPTGTSVLVFWQPYSPFIDPNRYAVRVEPRPDLLSTLAPHRLRATGANYLILSSLYWDRYFSHPGTSGAQREVFRRVFREFPEVARFTARSGTYGFHNPEIRILDLAAGQTTRE